MSTIAYEARLVQEETGSAPDQAMILRSLRLLVRAGQVFELRALGVTCEDGKARTVSGYFDNALRAARAAVALSPRADGVYITLSEIDPALLARANNRIRYAKAGDATADSDIRRLRWLFIDADPVRAAETQRCPATDEEHHAALDRAARIKATLMEEFGWPDMVMGDSGNGGHLLAAIDLPPEDADLLKRCLEALATRFDDEHVTVDRKTFNPARIDKLYGTMARKGDPTPERPHRVSRLLHVPREIVAVTRAQLEALAAQAPAPAARTGPAARGGEPGAVYDIEAFLRRHALDLEGPSPWQGGQKWVFRICPWNGAHTNRSAYILQHASGAISAGCHHNGCAGNDWRSLRLLYEPPAASADQDVAAELARLRAAMAQLEREREEARSQAEAARAELAALQTVQDRLDTDGVVTAIRALERQVAFERAKVKQLADVLEDAALPHRDRVVVALATIMAEAFRPPLEFGDAIPVPEPRRVMMAELERRAGVAPKTAGRMLKPAALRGLITREERAVEVTLPDGSRECRTNVFIGPGTGVARPLEEDRRRKAWADAQRRAREERAAREAALRARLAELERAAQEAASYGCPLCAGALLPTGYLCPHCGEEHTTTDLAARAAGRNDDSTTQGVQKGDGGGLLTQQPIYIRSMGRDFDDPLLDNGADPPTEPPDTPPPLDRWLSGGDMGGF